MKNRIFFVWGYINVFVFILLQLWCIIIIAHHSKTHRAFFAAPAIAITGSVENMVNSITSYFHLRTLNDQLLEENTQLRNVLKSNFKEVVPPYPQQFIAEIEKNNQGLIRKYTYLPAFVVNNCISKQDNYITVERGGKQNVRVDMGVVSSQGGIVGLVVETSDNYARIASLLNRQTSLSVMIKRNSAEGLLFWDGTDVRYFTVKDVYKKTAPMPGDTILTGDYSTKFPPRLMVGIVTEITNTSSTFVQLKVKSATNFSNLQNVYIISNAYYPEQQALEARTPSGK